MQTHLKLHATQLKQLTQTHPLHDLNAHSDPPRNMKATIFHNERTSIIIFHPDITSEECKEKLKLIHATITSQYFSSRKNNKVSVILHPSTFIGKNIAFKT